MLQTHRNCLNKFYLRGLDQTLSPRLTPVPPQSTLLERYKEESKTEEQIVQELYIQHFKPPKPTTAEVEEAQFARRESFVYEMRKPELNLKYVQYVPVVQDHLKSQFNQQKKTCSKAKEMDLAGLQTEAFRYLALEQPPVLETRLTDAKDYVASFLPRQNLPEDLTDLIVGSKNKKEKFSKDLIFSRSLKTPFSKSRFNGRQQKTL